ncbi:ABC transporter permease [Legionella erythra]|nr:ABC transporter permease [Legionella erythra]
MALILFQRTGEKAGALLQSTLFFFVFFGNFFYSLVCNWNAITWRESFFATLRAGTWVVIPLLFVSMLMGTSLAVSIHYMLAPYNLQHQGMLIAQNTVIHDFAPLTIGFVLCTQCGLNLIDFYHPSLHEDPQKVLLENIIPLVAGFNVTALLLYTYVSLGFLTSIFLTFYYYLKADINEYLIRLGDVITLADLLNSLCKTILYATIASFTAGYYYYDVANRILPTRKAVSRIITRGLFWLITVSVVLKLYLS